MILNNGKDVPLSLKWRDLYQLEQKDPQAFESYTAAVKKMETKPTELAAVRVLYTGYLCANEDPVTFEEFLDLLPDDHVTVLSEYTLLYRGKKKSSSAKS